MDLVFGRKCHNIIWLSKHPPGLEEESFQVQGQAYGEVGTFGCRSLLLGSGQL